MEIAMDTAVMEHDEQLNGLQSGVVSDWFSAPPPLGEKLTDEESEKLASESGYRLSLKDYFAFFLDDATGWTVHVYIGNDPLQ